MTYPDDVVERAAAGVHAAMCPDGEAAGFTFDKSNATHKQYCRRVARLVLQTLPPPAGVEWRAIETAPKDGTPILVWDGESSVTCFWCKCSQHWALVSENCSEWQDVTHWAPLPQPPLVQPGSQGGGHG